jgi:hypothetical protein
MQSWQRAFRAGLAPLLTLKGLIVLAAALETDDVRLDQGCTTVPQAGEEWFESFPVQQCCALALAILEGEGLETVTDVHGRFLEICDQASQRLGDPGAVAAFIRWHDDTPRHDMRRLLLIEVEAAIVGRRLPPGALPAA